LHERILPFDRPIFQLLREVFQLFCAKLGAYLPRINRGSRNVRRFVEDDGFGGILQKIVDECMMKDCGALTVGLFFIARINAVFHAEISGKCRCA